MNLVKTFQQYNDKCVFFCEPIKNNIMNDGNFIRILYSTNHVILNGIYLLFHLFDVTCEKYYNKYKCNFSMDRDTIDYLKVIEEQLLSKYKSNKVPLFKIYEQISTGSIKLFLDPPATMHTAGGSFVLKISGIWETQYNYGLTYKFVKCFSR